MNPEAQTIQARLRQIDDYERKGLMRKDEAAAARKALLHRLMLLLVPDSPAPRVSWRVHAGALAAMVVLVGSVAAYLWSGHAGLRRRSEEVLAAGKVAAAQDDVARRERLARIQAGESLAPDAQGVFPARASASMAAHASAGPGAGAGDGPDVGAAAGSTGSASAAIAMGTPAAAAAPGARTGADAIAPLLSGHVALSAALKNKAAPDDALFITVRLPDDPNGLPLAAIRKDVVDLPLDFDIGPRELLGAPDRFLHAPAVIVTARVSKTASGLARSGDLVGTSAPVAPWSGHVAIAIDRVVPGP